MPKECQGLYCESKFSFTNYGLGIIEVESAVTGNQCVCKYGWFV